jgi:hypothetical protein
MHKTPISTSHGKGFHPKKRMMTDRHQTITWGPQENFLFTVFVRLLTDRHHSFFFSFDSFPDFVEKPGAGADFFGVL